MSRISRHHRCMRWWTISFKHWRFSVVKSRGSCRIRDASERDSGIDDISQEQRQAMMFAFWKEGLLLLFWYGILQWHLCADLTHAYTFTHARTDACTHTHTHRERYHFHCKYSAIIHGYVDIVYIVQRELTGLLTIKTAIWSYSF